jgi:arginine decarboxylase
MQNLTTNSGSPSIQSYAQNSTPWNAEKSAELYGINNWGNGYFRVNQNGNVFVTPTGPQGPSVDLQ